MKVPIVKLSFDESEEKLLLETLRSRWIVQGKRVAQFETMFSECVGASCSVAVSNCTTALHLSLAAMGIGPGDEVVVPSFTYVATANAVEHTGARTVFCDVEPDTFNMDPRSLRDRISERTRAVIPVHLFGLAADMDPILHICKEHELQVVEDAACGLGATYRGKHVGILGDTGCFSFHPRKLITTAEGGMITLQNESLAERLRSMRDHGASASDFARHASSKPVLLPDFDVLGYNYRMTDLQGALGVAQMGKLDRILDGRRMRAVAYREKLGDVDCIKLPHVPEGFEHSYQSFVIVYTGGDGDFMDPAGLPERRKKRDQLIADMESLGVSTRQGTHAVHALGYYRKKYHLKPEDLIRSLACESLTIALPIYDRMTDEEQDHVVQSLRTALGVQR